MRIVCKALMQKLFYDSLVFLLVGDFGFCLRLKFKSFKVLSNYDYLFMLVTCKVLLHKN